MPDNGNGSNGRLYALNAAQLWARASKATRINPDKARALVDQVFSSYGLEPARVTDRFGWRHLALGSAEGMAGVVEWQPGEYYLMVMAPLFHVPADPQKLASFYRTLLELNHHGTLGARFSVHGDVVFVSLARPIRGLDDAEVDDAIRSVMMVADSYDDWLLARRDASLARVPRPRPELPALPEIKMTPGEIHTVAAVLAACDHHGQEIFRYLMERWYQTGYVVDPGASGIGLKIPIGSTLYSLADIRPGVGKRRQLIILGWEGLRRGTTFPSKAVDHFQATVLEITDVQPTESTAHIEVTEALDRHKAQALLQALQSLAEAACPTSEDEPA